MDDSRYPSFFITRTLVQKDCTKQVYLCSVIQLKIDVVILLVLTFKTKHYEKIDMPQLWKRYSNGQC